MTIRRQVKIAPDGVLEIHEPGLPAGSEAEVTIEVRSGSGSAAQPTRHFWEEILEISAAVPRQEWDRLPNDLAKNLDHYLYGAPKEE
jgi:hypothetical protein